MVYISVPLIILMSHFISGVVHVRILALTSSLERFVCLCVGGGNI